MKQHPRETIFSTAIVRMPLLLMGAAMPPRDPDDDEDEDEEEEEDEEDEDSDEPAVVREPDED